MGRLPAGSPHVGSRRHACRRVGRAGTRRGGGWWSGSGRRYASLPAPVCRPSVLSFFSCPCCLASFVFGPFQVWGKDTRAAGRAADVPQRVGALSAFPPARRLPLVAAAAAPPGRTAWPGCGCGTPGLAWRATRSGRPRGAQRLQKGAPNAEGGAGAGVPNAAAARTLPIRTLRASLERCCQPPLSLPLVPASLLLAAPIMARSVGRLLGLCLAMVTALAVATATTAKRCTYTDACSKKVISAFPGGFLFDSCRRAYSVSASCRLAKVRVCRFKDPCRLLKVSRTIWAPSGGVLKGACGTRWTVDSTCKATVAKACRPRSSSCNAFPTTSFVGQVVSRNTEGTCSPASYFVAPGCVYYRVARECVFRDSCAKAMRREWPGAVYVKCGRLYVSLPGCKEQRL